MRKKVQSAWITGRIAAFVLVYLLLLLGSCGMGHYRYGVVYGDDFWYEDVYLRNGDRRGDYIYYNGDWYYHGWGTPYSYRWDGIYL